MQVGKFPLRRRTRSSLGNVAAVEFISDGLLYCDSRAEGRASIRVVRSNVRSSAGARPRVPERENVVFAIEAGRR
jgi:hypothetical protein